MSYKSVRMNFKPFAIMGMILGVLVFSNQMLKGETSVINYFEPENFSIGLDTLPSQSQIQIQRNINGETMSLSMENGDIKELIVDGKVIPKSEYDQYKHLTDDIHISDGGSQMKMFFHDQDTAFLKNFNFDFNSEGMDEMFKNFNGMMFSMPDNFEELFKGFEGFNNSEQFQQLMEQFEENGIEGIPFGKPEAFDFSTNNKISDIIGNELNRDGLLEPYKQNQVELTGKYLKINGDKQPKNIWGKYKRLYEENTGMVLSKRARLDFEVEGKKTNRRLQGF